MNRDVCGWADYMVLKAPEVLSFRTGHLYVLFGDVSIQVLCPFFNWIVWFFGIQ